MKASFRARRTYPGLTEEQKQALVVRSRSRWRLCRYMFDALLIGWLAFPNLASFAILQAFHPIESPAWRGMLFAAFLLGNLLALAGLRGFLISRYGRLAAKRITAASLEQLCSEQSRVNG